ncbi:MAG: Tat pathway signal protein [Pseudomonadota bacterium]
MDRRQVLIGGGAVALAGAGAVYAGAAGMGSAEDYAAATARMRAALPAHPRLRDLIRQATLAPNGHNTQPWRFGLSGDRIVIRPDFARRTPVVDPDDHHLFVSLGAAAENLALASAAAGRPGELAFDPAGGGAIIFAPGGARPIGSALADAIPRRQSTRADYDGRPVGAADLRLLAAAAILPGVDVTLITDRPGIDRVRDLVVAGNGEQMADPAFLRELKAWLRYNPRQALATGDGLYSAASGNPILPAWLGPHAFDWFVTAASENDKYARQLRSSAGVAVFTGQRADPAHWVLVGRACQRFALQATALGLRQAFVNQPVEVARLRPALAALVGLPGRRPDIVMRFGHGAALPWSPRRPVERVMAG